MKNIIYRAIIERVVLRPFNIATHPNLLAPVTKGRELASYVRNLVTYLDTDPAML